jgi:hypothetical protein
MPWRFPVFPKICDRDPAGEKFRNMSSPRDGGGQRGQVPSLPGPVMGSHRQVLLAFKIFHDGALLSVGRSSGQR